jgi:Tfp pilus assembly protein PilX
MRRLRQPGDDGFAMIFTIFLIVVIAATSVAVFDLVASQTKPTAFAKKYVRTADAAAGGMQAALGQLRAAVSATTVAGANGDLTQLPCTDLSDGGGVTLHVGTPTQAVQVAGNSINGTVASDSNTGDVQTYTTTEAYFTSDPTSHEDDPTTAWWSANAITCKAGLLNAVPSYAFLQSVGGGAPLPGLSSVSGNRTEHATYQFNTTDSQEAGGRLGEFNLGNQFQMCLDAGAAEPTVGSQPEFEPCLSEGTKQQDWLYRNDLTIQYGGDTNRNLCIQNMSGTPQLEPCETFGNGPGVPFVATFPYQDSTQQQQEWAFNDNGHLQAPDTADGDVKTGNCLDPSGATDSIAATANAPLILEACAGGTTGELAWNPDTEVGAGKAGGNTTGTPGQPTSQFVNYALFGNCLDVTGQTFTNNYLIAYPCKQAPDSSKLTWNQIWNYTPVSGGNYGLLYTQCPTTAGTNGSNCAGGSAGNDCLQAPTSGNIVTGVKCSTATTPPDSQQWQATGQGSNYGTSYLLINKADGLCLAPDPNILGSGIPEIVVTACDGSGVPSGPAGVVKNPLLLKWNAPPTKPISDLANVQADQGSVTWGS